MTSLANTLRTCALLVLCVMISARKNGPSEKTDVRFGPPCKNSCCDASKGLYCVRFRPWDKHSTFATCMTYGACYQSNGKKDDGDWQCTHLSKCDPGTDGFNQDDGNIDNGSHDGENVDGDADDGSIDGDNGDVDGNGNGDSSNEEGQHDPAFCDLVQKLKESVPEQRRALISFWLTHGLDEEFGGFFGTLNRTGQPVLDGTRGNKGLVQQSRFLWTLSTYYDLFADEEGANATQLQAQALNVYDFLISNFLDNSTNLFIWQVKRDGEAEGSDINLYGNFFAVFAVAKYAEVFVDKAAASQALKSQLAMDAKFWDTRVGGYDQSEDSPVLDKDTNDTAVPKGFNANMHGMEALTQLYKTTKDGGVKGRLIDLIKLLSDKAFLPFTNSSNKEAHYYLLRYFDTDWEPILGSGQTEFLADHGHALQYYWLLLDAVDVLGSELVGTDDQPGQLAGAVAIARAAADYSAKWGYANATGYCDLSPVGEGCEGVDARWWWVQNEALLGLWQLYKADGDQKQLDRLHSTYTWLTEVQTDATHGEQYAIVNATTYKSPDLHSRLIEFEGFKDAKASFWKASYHSVRAFMNLDVWLREEDC